MRAVAIKGSDGSYLNEASFALLMRIVSQDMQLKAARSEARETASLHESEVDFLNSEIEDLTAEREDFASSARLWRRVAGLALVCGLLVGLAL